MASACEDFAERPQASFGIRIKTRSEVIRVEFVSECRVLPVVGALRDKGETIGFSYRKRKIGAE